MEPRNFSLHPPLSTWQCGLTFLLIFIFPLFGIYETAHPPKRIGPCSWIIDTSLRPSGVLQTPNFPGRFNVPARCRWILNASHSPDSYIVIWFTQLYVLTGLKITEYVEIEQENMEIKNDYNNIDDNAIYGGVGAHVLLDASSHAQLLNYTWVRSMMPYLVMELHLDQLEGNHVRTRDNLLDVFGFNMTYELVPREKEPNEFTKHCSVMECSYTGDCIADATMERYKCVCYEGFFGEQCEFGPLCNAEVNPCLNGGICRHMTADAVLCTCTDSRFYGPLCEFSNITDCEKGGLCEAQCAFDGRTTSVCNCGLGPAVPADRARYETTIGLANVTRSSSRDLTSAVAAAVNPGPARPLEALLESKLQKFLRGWNLTRVEDVKVLRVTAGSTLTFSFISGKQDREEMVLPALNALVRRGRLGPFELKSVVEFKKEPALFLESVRVNRERVLHEGDEFILSCLAQGSTAMEFRWFKDGIPVNHSLALRDIEQSLLNRDSRDMYTALLRIVSASYLDEGNYTCQVVDRGVQQCKSIYIEVATPPGVTISPMSVTLSKGENLTIFCMSSNDKRNEKFGFNWTKNNALLPASAGREMMEDLHPDGLLLRIYNAHQSATYACHVQGGGGSSSARVEVAVTTPGAVPLCRGEVIMGVQWPHTAPGQEARQPCPAPRPGSPRAARRLCTLYDTGMARWHQPDFSECVSAQLEKIHNKFRLLTLGYVATTPESTLRSLLVYLDSRTSLLPGEGEPVLTLLQDVHDFLRKRKNRSPAEVVATSRAACQALNVLLEHRGSLAKPEKVAELQHLMRRQALLWGAHLGTPSSAHLDLSAALLDVARLTSTGVYRLRFPLRPFEYPAWFSDKLDVRIQATNSTVSERGTSPHQAADSNVTLAVIVYRSLSHFLPERYVARKRDGDAVELELNSRVVSVAAIRGGPGALMEADGSDNSTGFVEVELELARRPNTGTGGKQWNATCAATRGTSWNLESSCYLIEPVGVENVTRCRCLGTGTFAALLTMHAPTQAAQRAATRQVAVALGCAWCLILSTIAMVLLAVHLWLHRSCLTFLKLQACVTVVGAMLIFICSAFATVPQSWYPGVTSVLELCLLVGLSSPLSTLMLVYTEVVQMRPAGGVVALKHLRHTVVSTITGLPVLAVFCSHLAHSSISGGGHPTLALTAGTPRFTIFVVSALGMAAIFMVVHSGATRRLHVLAAQNSGKNKAISRRIGLLKRATAIFSALVSVIVASLFYINIPSKTYQYVFSLTCTILGFVLLFCFAIKSETPLRIKDLIKMKEKQKSEGEFSSESLDSPLRLFLRPDVTRGNESANPGLVTDVDEGMTIVATSPPEDEGRELLPVRHDENTPARRNSPSPAHTHNTSIQTIQHSSTAETYIQPLNNTNKNVDLESYDSSPKKYQQDILPRPQPGRCFIETDCGTGVIVQACIEPEPSPTTSDQPWNSSGSPSSSSNSSGYVNMSTGNKHDQKLIRPIPVAPPCVPDLTYLPSLNKTGASKMICGESILINNTKSNSNTSSLINKNKSLILDCKDVSLSCCNATTSVLKQSLHKEDHSNSLLMTSGKKSCRGDSAPRVTFSGCDTVVEVEEPPPTPPPPPLSDIPSTSSMNIKQVPTSTTSSSHDLERKQPEGREMTTTADDNVEGMLDRISHDLDYLLSRKTETHQQQQPLRSALSTKKSSSNKSDLKVKIKEPGKVIYINSPTHSCNGACDSTE